MSASDQAARFERQYAEFRRSRTIASAIFWGLFAVCFAVSLLVARFDVVALIEGLPRTTDFIVKMIPPIGWSTFGADVGEWYWGIGKWLNSLLNTLLMAYLATVLGTVIGGSLSFLAARNLVKHHATYWVTRRVLEIARTVPDIVWALLFGFLVFGQLPDGWSIAGMTIIIASGLFLYLYLTDWTWYPYVLPIFGFFVYGVFSGHAIYLPELFPTHLRSTGTSFCYNVGRFVAALAPSLLVQLKTSVYAHHPEPMRPAGMTMCAVFALGLIVLPFLPETKGKPLPHALWLETPEEASKSASAAN